MSSDPEKETKPPLNSASSSTLPVISDRETLHDKDAKETRKNSDHTETSVTVKSEGDGEDKSGKKEEGEGKDGTGDKEDKEEANPKAELEKPGLLVTPGLVSVIEVCKKKVETIAKECRASNTKYRSVVCPHTLSLGRSTEHCPL